MNPDKLLTTPLIERALELARECLALNCLGAISGPPGTGKSAALRTVENRYASLGFEGRPLYLRCCAVQGPTRGVKDILDAIGVRTSLLPSGSTLQMTIKVALRELAARQIRLLLLDEADNWSLDSLQGTISLYDVACQQNQPLSLLFASASDVAKWMGAYASGLSRTLRSEPFTSMTAELALGVLREWSEPLGNLARRVEEREKEALLILKSIHKGTGGNFRRLNYFARLIALHHPGEAISSENVQAVLAKMLALP